MNWCWLLGHKEEKREWPYSGPFAKILVPYCKRCNKCLTTLPFQMQMQEVWHKAYEEPVPEYLPLYKDL